MAVLYNLAESLRIVSVLISMAMPHTAGKMREQLRIDGEIAWVDAKNFGLLPAYNVKKGDALFPRIEK
jgi:methionyl-tRNA synthetase